MLIPQAPEPIMDSYGRSICVVSDVDADKVLDFAIADGRWSSSEVVVDLRSGKTLQRRWRTSIKNGDVDCVLLVPAGDMSGDGRADIVLSLFNTSRVLVLSGADGMVVREFTSPEDYFGNKVCTGDFDSDGRSDVAIAGGRDHVRVFSGRDGRLLHAIVMPGEYVLDLTSGFDFNRDGTPDISIFTSDPQTSTFDHAKCRVCISCGKSGEDLRSFPWLDTARTGAYLARSPNLPRLIVFEHDTETELDDSNERVARERAHMAIFAPDQNGNARFALPIRDGVSFQSALCIAGDLNGDGVDDIVRGAHEAGSFFQGEVIAYSGKDWKQLWKIDGDGDLGAAVVGGIDFDGDKIPDVLAGAAQLYGHEHNGSVWAISGRTGKQLWTLTRESP